MVYMINMASMASMVGMVEMVNMVNTTMDAMFRLGNTDTMIHKVKSIEKTVSTIL